MKKTVGRKLPETVSFRLPEIYMLELLTRAQKSDISPGELAREIVIGYLEDEQRDRLESELAALKMEVAFFRSDFATAVEALLVLASGGSVLPIEAANWTQERLRQARTKKG